MHTQHAEADEADLVRRVAHRVIQFASPRAFNDAWSSFYACELDISAAHMNGCPLRLADMLTAPIDSLLHDVFGIAAHLDRRTGQLKGGFMPLYAIRPPLEYVF